MKALFLALALAISGLGDVRAAEAPSASPAGIRIETVRKVLQKQPNRCQAYNDLAQALIRRARETGDNSYFGEAESAIQHALRIQPANFEAAAAHITLLLAQHRYGAALEEAKTLKRRVPDVVMVWGDIAEAEAALGDYPQAEEAAQWMMDVRPGNLPAYLMGAELREDWGDTDGALDFFDKALQQTPPLETEERAWILTRMARVHRRAGRAGAADSLLTEALNAFPNYYAALEERAEVRLAQNRNDEAVELMEQRNRTFPSPASRLLAARALDRAGRPEDATKMYAEFERGALAQVESPNNANVELIAYYVDCAHRPAEALRIARKQLESRHDIASLDAYAWALHANGQFAEAGRQIDKALSLGSCDAVLMYHAGEIYAALGKMAEAVAYWQKSIDINASSAAAESARREISRSSRLAASR